MSKQSKALTVDARKMSAELFALSYGAIVADVVRDFDGDCRAANAQLHKIGFNMGVRLAEDFLAKHSTAPRCSDCRQMADVLSKQAIPLYLGVPATVSNWSSGDREFSLVLESNPLLEFVEVPANLSGLKYSSVLAGAVKGGLEAVHLKVVTSIVENTANTEIRVKFIEVLKDNLPAGED